MTVAKSTRTALESLRADLVTNYEATFAEAGYPYPIERCPLAEYLRGKRIAYGTAIELIDKELLR